MIEETVRTTLQFCARSCAILRIASSSAHPPTPENPVFAPQPSTLSRLFIERISLTPDQEAFRYPKGGGWERLTWKQTADRVCAIASGLKALGLEGEECCTLLSSTRVEWILADFGILCAGGATSTIYPSNTAEECAYILSDSGSVMAFAENDEQVAKIIDRRAELRSLRNVITFDGRGSDDGWVLTLADLEARGRKYDADHPGEFEKTALDVKPESLANLIYTSGTTGKPKGVEITHGTWAYEGRSTEASGILHPGGMQYLWLPLAHVFGKMLEAAQLAIGFPTAVDGRVENMLANLAEVKPAFVCSVPRVFEKVHNKVVASAREGGKLKFAIFRWAVSVGRKVSRLRQAGRRPGPGLSLKRALADRLVFRKIRALFGGELRFFVSGSAPLSREVNEFFDAMDIEILQGYGLTETCAGTFCNRPGKSRIGTVGPAMPGVDVKIAEDGEILIGGRILMRGYHNLPEETKEALEDGWLQTGDIGFLDSHGYLTITDRKKDLIKTSGGKYVAPQELESRLKAICPYVSQVLVHGNQRNYVTGLVTLDEEAVRKWAQAQGLEVTSLADLSKRSELQALVQQYIDRLNENLPRFATLKRFAVLPVDFSEAAGELTPSQKVKRKAIETKYGHVLDSLYENGNRAPE
jgi:long-chain acyl-CoA synthetase